MITQSYCLLNKSALAFRALVPLPPRKLSLHSISSIQTMPEELIPIQSPSVKYYDNTNYLAGQLKTKVPNKNNGFILQILTVL